MKVDRILRLWRLGVRARALIQQRRLSQTLAHVEVVFFQRRHQRRRFLHARNHFPSSGFLRVDPQARLYVFTHFYAPVLLRRYVPLSLFSLNLNPPATLSKNDSRSLSLCLSFEAFVARRYPASSRSFSERKERGAVCKCVCSCELFLTFIPPPQTA